MSTILTMATVAAALRLSIPVALAAMGAVVSERSGVLNLGVEGMMLTGAFAAYSAAEASGSPWLGLVAGLAAGAAAGLLLAVFVVIGRSNQIVTGIAFTLLAGYLTTYLFQRNYAIGQIPPRLNRIDLLALVVLTAVVVVAVYYLLQRTTFGLALGAVGESPEAADALGYDVVRIRVAATIIGGGLAGLGGAALVCGPLGLFIENVTAGRGWVALALVVFSGWKTFPAVVGAFLFGLSDAIQLRLQGTQSAIPYEFFLALPYMLTLMALVLRARASRTPAALGVAFVRGAH
ncbi:MAG: ABC transporter permease [Acidimicrobiales bacterium]|nr:ABC transporter permease [Acidimicrobiales bacterium]